VPNRENDNDHADRSIGKTEHREQRLNDLDNQPRRNDVSRCYSQHVATLELVEERHLF